LLSVLVDLITHSILGVMSMINEKEHLKNDEGKHKKQIVALSAFTLMLLGAGGVGSSAHASNFTTGFQIAKTKVSEPAFKVAKPIFRDELKVHVAVVRNPQVVHTFYNHHNNGINRHNNIWTGNNLNTKIVENTPEINTVLLSRRFDV
jgi:hypothetical protein